MLIEDCAQSYVGNRCCGSKFADVSLFSFGSIKTNTALGGAVLFVRDPLLKEKLESNQSRWPVQPNRTYWKRVVKYAIVKTISTWPVAALIRMGFRVAGSSHDSMAAGMAKGFAGEAFFEKIRQQPSRALLSVLARRIRRFDPTFDRAARNPRPAAVSVNCSFQRRTASAGLPSVNADSLGVCGNGGSAESSGQATVGSGV